MRPCRGRDAGSALAPATQTLLCWCSAYLYRRPLPPQLRTGGSWSASVGPKERDDPGEGRRALGEKAFSSDPRGSLGVSDPPAAAPPACAVAAVAAAKSAWAEHPAPHLPSGGGGGRVRRPRGGAVCRSLPTAARASPLRVGGGSRWAPPGVRQVGGDRSVRAPRVRAVGPRGVVSLGAKGGRCWGRDVRSAPASPAPQPWCGRAYRARPLPTSRSRWRRAVTVGAASLESVIPRMSSLGVADLDRKTDLSRTDGGRWVWAARRPWRRGRVVGARSGAGRDRSASQACRGTALVCGWRWDPALVFLVARPCSRCLCGPRMAPAALSRGPRRACLPAPPRRCRPLLLVPRVRPPRAPFPCLGPSRPRLMWVSFPRPPSAGGVPEAGRRAGSFARVGDVGAAGARRESVLPGRLAALGCVSVAVGVSPREGAGGGAPVRRPGRAVGPSLCWEASGGEIPRWALAADSRFPLPQHGSL